MGRHEQTWARRSDLKQTLGATEALQALSDPEGQLSSSGPALLSAAGGQETHLPGRTVHHQANRRSSRAPGHARTHARLGHACTSARLSHLAASRRVGQGQLANRLWLGFPVMSPCSISRLKVRTQERARGAYRYCRFGGDRPASAHRAVTGAPAVAVYRLARYAPRSLLARLARRRPLWSRVEALITHASHRRLPSLPSGKTAASRTLDVPSSQT
ncbi:hypothetical protein KVR01_005780 [Diaporthe batatas]|uniref:uncharacterized protein n=1 Tax=Diaporthe batatas TaxID=748121 RepID=UPI001D04070B|nr:uncharacterized protein KVR01_005780 [Diaporthe batatas]KAG8163862.1 hypothetical protein KVR01_005780 [Diaporthe batatas]